MAKSEKLKNQPHRKIKSDCVDSPYPHYSNLSGCKSGSYFKPQTKPQATVAKYSSPILYHYNYDLSKKWLVGFSYTSSEGASKRFQFRGDINKFSSKKDRILEANSLIAALKEMLNDGWNPVSGENEIEEDKFRGSLIETLNFLNSIRRSSLKPDSVRTFEDVSKSFCKYLVKSGFKDIYPGDFKKNMALKYLDSLLIRDVGPATFNKHKNFMNTYFNLMIDRKLVKKEQNPFAGIKSLRRDIGRNIAFTDLEREKLSEALKKRNPKLYLFVQFMFYCALRRTEILGLRVEDVNLKERFILVSYGTGKNRKQDSVSIPPEFLSDLTALELNKYQSWHYVFSAGKGMSVGPDKRKKADSITDLHRVFLRELKIPKTKTIYSWKHTGVVTLYNEIKDVYAIMRHCRHSDLEQTMTYLKSLGLQKNTPVLNSNIKI